MPEKLTRTEAKSAFELMIYQLDKLNDLLCGSNQSAIDDIDNKIAQAVINVRKLGLDPADYVTEGVVKDFPPKPT